MNEELMQALFVVLAPEVEDLHGHIYSENEIRKACHDYNVNCMETNLFHVTDTDLFEVVESYIAPVDFLINGTDIIKGSWLAVVQVYDQELWNGIKSGEINGISISAYATVTKQQTTNLGE